MKGSSINTSLNLAPIDVESALQQVHPCEFDAYTTSCWNGCSMYITKSISRLSLIHVALGKPSKDLNTYMIDRCCGMSEHLVQIVIDQRRLLCQQFDLFYILRQSTGELLSIWDKDKVPKSIWVPLCKQITQACSQLVQIFHELEVLLLCCPSSDSTEVISSPLYLKNPNSLSSLHKEHPAYSQSLQSVIDCQHVTKNILKQVSELSVTNVSTISFVEHTSKIASNVSLVCEQFQCIYDLLFSTEHENEIQGGVATIVASANGNLQSLKGLICSWLTTVQEGLDSCKTQYVAPTSDADIIMMIEELIQSLLLAIQHVKEHVSSLTSEPDVSSNIFFNLANGSFKPTFNALDMGVISKKLGSIQRFFAALDVAGPTFVTSVHLWKRCEYLLTSYCNLVQYVLTEYISSHRATSKSTFVLLGLFVDLIQKGFCLPSDVSDDVGSEEKTEADKFDTEEHGLGSGEGQKDVSDQIETEDQLDDIKHNEARQEEDNHDDLPEDQENGIEMSENFEGQSTAAGSQEDEAASDDEDQVDNEMGEADGKFTDTLDTKMWDSDDDAEESTDESKMDNPGKGQPEMDTELGARDRSAIQSEQTPMDHQVDEKIPDDGLQDNEFDYQDADDQQIPNESDPRDDIDDDRQDEMTSEFPENLELDDVESVSETEVVEVGNIEDDASPEIDNEKGREIDELEQQNNASDGDEVSETPQDEIDPQNQHVDNNMDEITASETLDKSLDSANSGMGHEEHNESNSKSDVVSNVSGRNRAKQFPSAGQPERNEEESSHNVNTSENRQTGNINEPIKKHGQISDSVNKQDASPDDFESEITGSYEHIQPNTDSSFQVVDLATEPQAGDASVPEQMDVDIGQKITDNGDEEAMDVDVEDTQATGSSKKTSARPENKGEGDPNVKDVVTTTSIARNPYLSFHGVGAVERLSTQFSTKSLKASSELIPKKYVEISIDSLKTWDLYETSTLSLAQELCEQLRLVLHPTGGKTFKGDFRTGKRLNMRRIIPYIASQFRKDKIWLRRTKPHKREYQIMMALDDSSSMADNNLKKLAFESVAVVANALNLLQVGQLGVCSFGDEVEMIHNFQEPFSSHSGANILHNFTFQQNKTKIAQMLKETLNVFQKTRASFESHSSSVSKLLLILSDGRGIFFEGMSTVLSAVREAINEKIFIVFIILDNPGKKSSILDIKIPLFKGGSVVPEICTYMESFPFPHYIILRGVESLPLVLSDAIRQWFEMVSHVDYQ